MKNELGFDYTGDFKFAIPKAQCVRDALCIFKKNKAAIVWNCMSSLERNPATLPQTETILKGKSVSGITIDELMQVKHYGDGVNNLIYLLENNTFRLDIVTVCLIHKYVGQEALTWGELRDSDVTIRGINYIPPSSKDLASIAEKGFSFLESIESPCERAVACFLFMARNQFFHDANKRTASIIMNAILLQSSYYPIAILDNDSEEFNTKLSEFYNTGNATPMMRFFEDITQDMYPKDVPASQMEMT